MRQTARTVVWEGPRAQSRGPDPIQGPLSRNWKSIELTRTWQASVLNAGQFDIRRKNLDEIPVGLVYGLVAPLIVVKIPVTAGADCSKNEESDQDSTAFSSIC